VKRHRFENRSQTHPKKTKNIVTEPTFRYNWQSLVCENEKRKCQKIWPSYCGFAFLQKTK